MTDPAVSPSPGIAVASGNVDSEEALLVQTQPAANDPMTSDIGRTSNHESFAPSSSPGGSASDSPFAADEDAPRPPALAPRLAATASIDDAHLRQVVTANIRLQTRRQIQAFTDQQRDLKAQAKAVIDQGGDLSAIAPRLMLQIDAGGRQALHDYAFVHANPQTDPVTYYHLKNQALDDAAGFQEVDLSDHMARLNAKDYAELQQLQNNLRNGQPPADLPLQQVYKTSTDRMLQQLGLPVAAFHPGQAKQTGDTPTATVAGEAGNPPDGSGRPWLDSAVAEAVRLRQAVDLGVAAHEVVQGRKATPAEHQQILDQAVINHVISPVGGTTMTADGSLLGPAAGTAASALGSRLAGIAVRGADLLGEATLGTIGGAAAGFLAGMWPTSTAGPALDEFQGAQINEASKKKDKGKPPANPAGTSPTPNPQASDPQASGPRDPNQSPTEPPVFKRPNDDLKINDRIDLKRFTERLKVSKQSPLLRDPESGYTIQKDATSHGESAWKLRDRLSRPVGTLGPDGNLMRLPSNWR